MENGMVSVKRISYQTPNILIIKKIIISKEIQMKKIRYN